MAIDLGDTYQIAWTSKSTGGGLVNPDTVTLTITLPDGSAITTAPIPPVSTGNYRYDYVTTLAGRHQARWVGTGANAGAQADIFDVVPASPPYLISLSDAKEQLNTTNTVNDEEIRGYVEAATSAIELHKNECIVQRTFTEEHYLSDGASYNGQHQSYPGESHYSPMSRLAPKLALNNFPVLTLTSVARVDGTLTWDVVNLHVDKASGVVSTIAGTPLSGHVTVTYTAGYRVIPGNYLLAARIIVQHLWETQRGSSGGLRPGSLEDSMGFQQRGFAIPNRALEILGDRMPGFA